MSKEAKKKVKLIYISNMDIVAVIDELFGVTDNKLGINKIFKKKPPRGIIVSYVTECIKKLAKEKGVEIQKTNRVGYNEEKVFDYLSSK